MLSLHLLILAFVDFSINLPTGFGRISQERLPPPLQNPNPNGIMWRTWTMLSALHIHAGD